MSKTKFRKAVMEFLYNLYRFIYILKWIFKYKSNIDVTLDLKYWVINPIGAVWYSIVNIYDNVNLFIFNLNIFKYINI